MILVDLMVVICSRPKGMFKDCYIRINAGIDRAKGAIPVLSCVNVSIVLLMILKLWELGNEGVLPWYTILLKFHCFPSFVQWFVGELAKLGITNKTSGTTSLMSLFVMLELLGSWVEGERCRTAHVQPMHIGSWRNQLWESWPWQLVTAIHDQGDCLALLWVTLIKVTTALILPISVLVLLELTEQLGQIIVVGDSLQSHIYAF